MLEYGEGEIALYALYARFVIYAFILWRHLPSSCCLNLVPPSVVVFNVLQISFSGFLPEPFKISKNGFLHITLHTSAQNILKLQVPRSKALGGVWTESSKMSPLLYNNRFPSKYEGGFIQGAFIHKVLYNACFYVVAYTNINHHN